MEVRRLERSDLDADEEAAPARELYDVLGYRQAHGPFVSSTNLAGDDGPIAVGAVLTYVVKDL